MSKSFKRVLYFGVLCVLVMGGFAAQENPFSTPHAKGLIPLDDEQDKIILTTWPRVDRVNFNWLGLERVNKVKALKGKMRLDPSIVRPVGKEVESSIHAPGVSVQAVGLNEELLGDLPVSVDNSLLQYFPPIRNQGMIGSCVSFATTYYQLSYMTAFERNLDIRADGDNTNKYSPKWTYNMINGGGDAGSTFDENYYLLECHGAATWAEFPYDDNYLAWCLDTSAWRNALSVKPQTHQYAANVSTDSGLELAKELLNNGYILVIGTYINSWQGTIIQDDTSTTDDDTEVGKVIGYWVNGYEGPHAMTVVGYNDAIWTDINGNATIDVGEKGAFRIANSWGTDWMDGGFVWASYDALRSVSAVPGGPSENRIGALQQDRAYLLTARDNYSPTLIGELTLNHARRYHLGMGTGLSSTSATEPETGWIMYGFYQQGGVYAFDGTTTACDGTFVFDFTDLAVSGEARRYYLYLWDQISEYPAILSYFKLIDTTTDPDTEILCTMTPMEADNELLYPYVDYTYTGPDYNNPPALTFGYVSPTSGTTATTFSFYVYYDDSYDGNAPTVKNIYIDETPYAMTLYSGSAYSGTYRYQTALGVGTHTFRFHFEDGNGGSTDYPPEGTIDGPVVGLDHTVSQPSAPSGETNPVQGTSYAYSTGGSTCVQGDDIQYRFDWGDGVISDWLPVGQTSATHAWSSSGSFSVMAQARCSVETAFMSSWSAALSVYIDFVVPFTESFPGSSFPVGWTQQNIGTGTRWAVTNTSNAGGQAREMRCSYQSSNPATTRLVTPPINTTGYSSLRLSFKHYLNADDTGCVLKIQTSPNSSTWTDETWAIDSTSSNIGPETVEAVLTHNLNIETTYVAFVITGDLYAFDYWYIDDVFISGSSPKVDFNGDGQEDILWRYHGTGEIQGWDVVWLMQQNGALSPARLGIDQKELAGMNLRMGTSPNKSYLTPLEVGNSRATVPAKSSMTPLGMGKSLTPRPKKVMRDATDNGRGLSPKSKGRTRGKEFEGILPAAQQDAAKPSPASSGTMEIASLDSSGLAFLTSVLDTAWEIAGTGDFNGDGNTDILWRYYGGDYIQGWNVIWYMDGTTITSYGFLPTVRDTNWKVAGTGDFDGDGKLEVLWRYYGGGNIQGWNVIWHLDGETIASYGFPTAVLDLNWRIDGIGDFNGDGKSDMLWRYYGSDYYQGLNVIWYMDGETLTGYGFPTAVTKLGWKVDGIGDYDGDGKSDILWRYYDSGYHQGLNVVWYMDGATIKSQENLTVVWDTNWRIVNR